MLSGGIKEKTYFKTDYSSFEHFFHKTAPIEELMIDLRNSSEMFANDRWG